MQEFLHRREIEQLPEVLARRVEANYYPQALGCKLSYTHVEGSISHEDNLTETRTSHLSGQ